ncbi:MAG: toxin-antitoxin system TumE family protein [Bacteriovoracaceae bacterium]
MSSELIKHFKQYVHSKYVLEVKIWAVDDKRYPDRVKYSLIFIDTKTGRKVLMDNHYPKNPHVHLDEKEMDYEYKGEDKLFSDFEKFVLQHFGVKL